MLRGEKKEGKHKRTLVLSDENYSFQGENKKIPSKDMCLSYCPLLDHHIILFFIFKHVPPREEKEEAVGNNYFMVKKTKIPLSHNNKRVK
nr:hypothetical protein [Candidatus Liberibacter asiaticus]